MKKFIQKAAAIFALPQLFCKIKIVYIFLNIENYN